MTAMENADAAKMSGDAVDFNMSDADPRKDGQNNQLGGTTTSQTHQDAALKVACSTEDCQDGALGDAKAAGDGEDSTTRNADSAKDCQDGACRDANSAGDGHNGTPVDANSAEDCQNDLFRDASPKKDIHNGPCQGTDTSGDCQEDDPPAKRKKQEEEDISGGDIFFIDKKGGETFEQPPLYTADFIFPEDEAAANEPEPEGRPHPSFECFNCGGGHHLRDCPNKIDSARVARKRREMARERDVGPKKMRYFEFEIQSQRFQPGKLSEELLYALGVNPRELPYFTYRMRVLGYPPGWLEDAEIQESGLKIYGLDDTNANDEEDKEVQYDTTRFIDFPGFNVPAPQGVYDRWEEFKMPPMVWWQQRTEVEKYLKAQAQRRQDQRKKLPAAAVRPSPAPIRELTYMRDSQEEESGLEGTTPVPDSVCNTPSMPLDAASTSSHTDANALKQPTPPDAAENGESASTEEAASASPKVKLHRVTLGTPMLLGFSEYTSLPPRENFAKDTSEFIPFENLPGTTGRYNRLRQVINKVRAMRKEDKREAGNQ